MSVGENVYQRDDLEMQLRSFKKNLALQFQAGNWSELSRSLERLASLGETEGQMELCLRAQSLREILGVRASGRTQAGARVDELFHELMFHFSHFQWKNQVTQ